MEKPLKAHLTLLLYNHNVTNDSEQLILPLPHGFWPNYWFLNRVALLHITLGWKLSSPARWGCFQNSLSTVGVNEEVSLQPPRWLS